VHDIIEDSIMQSYEKDFKLLDIMDENLTLELEKLEAVLDKNPSNGDLDFAFSYKNKKLLQKLLTDFLRSFDVANKISNIKKMQYGLVYYIMQSTVRLVNWQIPYKQPKFDMETKLQRLAYFSKYAIGIMAQTSCMNLLSAIKRLFSSPRELTESSSCFGQTLQKRKC